MALKVETEKETDDRWIAEVTDLPGIMAYGKTRQEAVERAQLLAHQVIVDRSKHGEALPGDVDDRSRE
ncbi:MAG: type II toxin-antitoxin system HicB family antitoxin [Planctomycetia bacterium]|nr:type II toxin-antitoxin system HicB family antitoxin [Planctomycetia bacterium]